jgi:protein required for attachment to host cells
MPKSRNLLFVIADGEHVRFVRPTEDNTLHSDAVLDSSSVHKRSADLGSDRPGAAFHSGSSAYNTLVPHHDLHVLEKVKFGRTIAQRLNLAAAGDEFDELVIVAPPHTLVAVRQRLNAATEARIVGTMAKDLVKVPDHELWPHLQGWVRPTRHETS